MARNNFDYGYWGDVGGAKTPNKVATKNCAEKAGRRFGFEAQPDKFGDLADFIMNNCNEFLV